MWKNLPIFTGCIHLLCLHSNVVLSLEKAKGQEVEDGGIYFNFCCAFSLEFQKNFNIQCMHISNKPYAFLEARNYSGVTEKHQLLNSMEDDGGRKGIF